MFFGKGFKDKISSIILGEPVGREDTHSLHARVLKSSFPPPPGTKIQGDFPPVIFNLRIWRLSDLEMTVGVDSKSDTKSLSSVLETGFSLTDAIFYSLMPLMLSLSNYCQIL